MGFSLARLTLYGTLSCIDEDLRNIVKSIPTESTDRSELIGAALLEKLKERRERDLNSIESDLIDFMDMGDALSLINRHKSKLMAKVAAFFDKHSPKLTDLIPIRNRVMHSRPIQFSDMAKVDLISQSIRSNGSNIFPGTMVFLKHIEEDPYYPFSIDVSDIQSDRSAVAHNLPLPDFDETGFLGRETETAQLVKACKGPWPIITVVAEGGYGKTALALQASYELLDDPSKPFEYVVWTSSKTTRLALHDVEEIEGAISDSIGIFRDISLNLKGSEASDPMEEVLSYLNTFRILLVIDNLETVLDKSIIDFFSKLNGKSKILVTSRIGTGEMNFRFPLEPLSISDSVRLLRATARARRVDHITKTKDSDLAAYCRRMKNNPGFIKWFVSTVQAGRRPEEALVDPKVFLDFCLSNVYEHVSADAKKIANVMLSVPGRHSQSVISYISEISGDGFRQALQQLWSANIATMLSVSTAAGYQTVYELGELPRLFILKNHAPSKSDVRSYQLRKRKISDLYKQHFAKPGTNKYMIGNIGIRTQDDTVVAKYLMDALTTARSSYEEGLKIVERAKELDPAFYEVYRVEAIIHRNGGNYPAAAEAYSTAISCEPRSSALRYWYAGFLMRDSDDLDGAVKQFELARELDPDSAQVALEFARCLMFSGDYDGADKVIESAIFEKDLPTRTAQKVQHLGLQIPLRHLNFILQDGTLEKKSCQLEVIRERFRCLPDGLFDEPMAITMREAKRLSAIVFDPIVGDLTEAMQACREWFHDLNVDEYLLSKVGIRGERQTAGGKISDSANGHLVGSIVNYDYEKRFGFIELDTGGKVFFHKSDFMSGAEQIALGVRVAFELSNRGVRNKAIHLVVVIEEYKPAISDESEIERYEGIIKTYISGKGFGFIYWDDGKEIFFHRSGLEDPADQDRLDTGMRVHFVKDSNHRGVCAGKIRLID